MADVVVLQPAADDLLPVAIAAHLARYKGLSRVHTRSDLQVFLRWCAEHEPEPLRVPRSDAALFRRWLEEIRRFKPSTVPRRLSVVTCFYRTCVIDAVLEASPAAYVGRPPVPNESPDARPVPSPVRGHDRRRPHVGESVRLCPCRSAWTAQIASVRGLPCRHRRPRRGARPPGP